MNTKESSVK